MSSTLEVQIGEFQRAFAALKAASSALDATVQAQMENAGESVPALQALVDQLPEGYRNVRRIYEKIARLDATIQALESQKPGISRKTLILNSNQLWAIGHMNREQVTHILEVNAGIACQADQSDNDLRILLKTHIEDGTLDPIVLEAISITTQPRSSTGVFHCPSNSQKERALEAPSLHPQAN